MKHNPYSGQAPPCRPLVEVTPLGQVSPAAAEVAAAHLQGVFDLPARVLPPQPEPDYAFLPSRGQYDAGPILLALAQGGSPGSLQLGLTNKDLCLPFLSHVYGQAQLEGRSAVVSLYRLRGPGQQEAVTSHLVLERMAKVAQHEIAHVMGLLHCDAGECLMNFSPGLEYLDRLKMILCPSCREQLAWQRLRLLAKTGQGASDQANLTTPSQK